MVRGGVAWVVALWLTLCGALAAAACPPGGPPVPALGVERAARVLAVGSSTTAGVGASRPEAAWTALLAARLGAEVVAAGVSGEAAAGALGRLPALLAQGPWDAVLWQLGANDARDPGVSEQAFVATVAAGLAAIRAAGARPLLIGPQVWPADPDPARTARFDALLGEAGAPLLPRHAAMARWDAGALAAMTAPDGLHANDAGHACLAAMAAQALAPP